eukprot:CAMPEP_0197677352 /NCGR_PEP_ID=MMETSP1338-20131121/88260_1 /TAXON_ID=43686 ORGANISM="Pelagodinium beii, Strain RCC1491" /NCGR_SAMPLE_ID=MMETSP1338 /ASSEMBLY_ACC=CAM_ASM_000754 /LENGTH=554 /DNA_ID=CAMNT_0043258167 /DNA_START=138 /DNA_END=1802 /DNA_ORIENTATION=-
MSYLSCLLGGYLADNRIGRYRTILYFATAYIFGVALVTTSAVPEVMSSSAGLPVYLLGSFVFVALGTGAIKPNVMNFGADQYDTEDADEAVQQKAFFSYFYLTINIGVVFAMGFTVNLATSHSTTADAGDGYMQSYGIATGAMLLAIISFAAGTPKYVGKGGVTHAPMVSVIWKHLLSSAQQTWRGKACLVGWCLIPVYMIIVLAGSLLGNFPGTSQTMTWVAMGLALASCSILTIGHLRNDFIEGASIGPSQSGSISSADVKSALQCVPTIICINVGFNIPYNAMNNAYPAQACQMDTRFLGQQLNGSFFSLGDAFAIILLVPCFEKLLYPAVKRWQGGQPISRLAKYTTGFSLAIVANLSAALIEHVRRAKSTGNDPDFVQCPEELLGTASCAGSFLLSKCSPGARIPMTNMSAFWTFIPMFLTGAGEILVNPVVYQYVFEEAPSRLRSMLQALNLVAAGSISNAITAALSPLVPENFNSGHLVYYYYTNCVLAVVALAAYLSFTRSSFQTAAVTVEGSVHASLLASVDRGASVATAPSRHAASLLGAETAE